jgi:hypothetical protein
MNTGSRGSAIGSVARNGRILAERRKSLHPRPEKSTLWSPPEAGRHVQKNGGKIEKEKELRKLSPAS